MERAVGETIFWQVCVVGCAARTLSEQLSLGPSEQRRKTPSHQAEGEGHPAVTRPLQSHFK